MQKNPEVVVVALARGGVVIGFEIAHTLQVPLDIVVPRKIGVPGNPELAIGAITQEGELWLNYGLMGRLELTKEMLAPTIAQEMKEA
jgi:predicted phosphoribosyltransferase